MSLARRAASAALLALFVFTGVVAPFGDAMLHHADALHPALAHVESTDNPDCHAEECSLGSPVAPSRPGFDLGDHFSGEFPIRRVGGASLHDLPLDRSSPRKSDSRAPPA